jgi:heptosyltransferase-2
VNIALLKVAALGDVVRTTAILPGLRRRHPRARLWWITSRDALDLIRHQPAIDVAVASDEPDMALAFDVVFDWLISLDEERSSCGLATGLRARRLSGAALAVDGHRRYTADTEPWFGLGLLRADDRGGLVQANVLKKSNEKSHAALLYEMLDLPGPVARPALTLPKGATMRAAAWWQAQGLDRSALVIGLNTSAGPRWRLKAWGEHQTADLAVALHDRLGAHVVVLGGAAETGRTRRIVDATSRPRVIAAPAEWPLPDFAAIVHRLDGLVSSDSLALHVAIAGDVPAVALFGPTSPSEIDLFGRGEKIVTPLACRGCYLSGCSTAPHCMDTITPEVVFAAVKRSIDAHASSR